MELVNLYNPDLYSATINQLFKIKSSKIKKLENELAVNKIYEDFNIASIGWSGTNLYYQNKDTLRIEAVEQEIHPRLPRVKVEYYVKY